MPIFRATCRPPYELSKKAAQASLTYTVYPTEPEISSAIVPLIDMHSWAIDTAAKAYAILNHGPEYLNHLTKVKPGAIMYTFTPRLSAADPRHLDPNDPFMFNGISTLYYDRYREDDDVYDRLRPTHPTIMNHYTREFGPGHTPDGILDVVFHITCRGSAHARFVPQWLPHEDHPPLHDPRVYVILEDLVTLCCKSLGTHLPFGRTNTYVAYPGRYVSSGKKRETKWEPLFEDWGQYLSGRIADCKHLEALEGLKTNYTPPQMMQILHMFEPRHARIYGCKFVPLVFHPSSELMCSYAVISYRKVNSTSFRLKACEMLLNPHDVLLVQFVATESLFCMQRFVYVQVCLFREHLVNIQHEGYTTS